MQRHFLLILSAFLLSWASMPVLIRLARRLGIVDRPTHRKIHVDATPYLGGLGIILGAVIVPLGWFTYSKSAEPDYLGRMLMLLTPCFAAGMLGLADDKFQVRARVKFIVQFLIVTLFTLYGTYISLLKFPAWDMIELNDIGIPVTILWMLCVINGVNLIDGVDGLAASVNAIIFAAIAWLAASLKDLAGGPNPDIPVLVVALAALGATLGFLYFNWKPAKIYMGDAGSLASGTLIATLLVSLGRPMSINLPPDTPLPPYEPFPYQFGTITLIAAYPLMEIWLSVLRRLLTGKPIATADKGHVHHRLLRFGFSAPMICGSAIVLSAMGATVAVAVRLHYHGVASGVLVAGGIVFVLLMYFCGFLELLRPRHIKGNRPHFLIANHFMAMQRIKLDLAESFSEIEALAAQTCIEFGVARYMLRVERKEPLPPLVMDWIKPASAHGSLLLATEQSAEAAPASERKTETAPDSPAPQPFSDKVELSPGTFASWTFEPHIVEDEIDVEYRVLFNDFMRKALKRAEALSSDSDKPPDEPRRDPSQPAGPQPVSSTALRRRGTQSTRVTRDTFPPKQR